MRPVLKLGSQLDSPPQSLFTEGNYGLGGFSSTPGFSFANKTGKNLEAPRASGKRASKKGGGEIAEIYSFN